MKNTATSKNLIKDSIITIALFLTIFTALSTTMTSKAAENSSLSVIDMTDTISVENVFSVNRDRSKLELIATGANVNIVSSGWDSTGGYFYLDTTGWNQTTVVQLVIGHGTWHSSYTMSKVANSNLYYYAMGNWGGYDGFGFTGNATALGSGSGDYGATIRSASCYTDLIRDTKGYNITSGTYYLITKDNANDHGSVTTTATHSSRATTIDYAQTAIARVSTNGGTSFATDTSASAGTTSITGYTSSASTSSTSSTTNSSNGTATANKLFTSNMTVSTTQVNPAKYTFLGWSSNGTTVDLGTSTSMSVTVPKSATTYYALYKQNQYTVSKNTPTNGTISVSPTTVNYGNSSTATVTPNEGYRVATFTVNGVDHKADLSNGLAGGTYTISNITSNTTVAVTFELKDFYALGPAVNGNNASWDANPITLTKQVGEATLYSATISEDMFYSGGQYVISSTLYSINNISATVGTGIGVSCENIDSNFGGQNIKATLNEGYSAPYTIYYDSSTNTSYMTATPSTYNLTYYDDNGTTVLSSDTFIYGEGKATLYTPTKTNYYFLGWYDNPQYTGSAVSSISSTTATDVDLYSKWVSNINVSSVTLSVQASCAIGETVTITANYTGGVESGGTETTKTFVYSVSYDNGATWETLYSGNQNSYDFETNQLGDTVSFRVQVSDSSTSDSGISPTIAVTITMRNITFNMPVNALSFGYSYYDSSRTLQTVTNATQSVTVEAAGGYDMSYTVTPDNSHYVNTMTYTTIGALVPYNFDYVKQAGTVSGTLKVAADGTVDAVLHDNPTVTVYGYENDGTTSVNTEYGGVRISSDNGGVSGIVAKSASFQVKYNSTATSTTTPNSGGTAKLVAQILNTNRYDADDWYADISGSKVLTAGTNYSGYKVSYKASDLSSLTVSSVTQDVSVYVHFVPKYALTVKYTHLAALTDGTNTINNEAIIYLKAGDTVSFTATVGNEYKLTADCWSVNNGSTVAVQDNKANAILTMGTADSTLTITPKAATYTGAGVWGSKYLYIDTTNLSGDYWYSAYFFNSTNTQITHWIRMNYVGNKVYSCIIPNDCDSVVLRRKPTSDLTFGFDTYQSNQSADIALSTAGSNNEYVFNSYTNNSAKGMNGTWRTYTEQ